MRCCVSFCSWIIWPLSGDSHQWGSDSSSPSRPLSFFFLFFFCPSLALPSPKYDLKLAWRHRAGVIQSGSPQGRPMLISYTQSCSSVSSSPQDSPQSDSVCPISWDMTSTNIPHRAKKQWSSLRYVTAALRRCHNTLMIQVWSWPAIHILMSVLNDDTK